MARNEEMERRLLNWARWRLTQGGGPLGYAAVNLETAETGVRTPYEDVPVPTSGIEASETEDSVRRLPSELKRTVEVHYLDGGNERRRLAKLCIGKSTLHARIERAHRLLAEHFAARSDRAKAERARVERLQVSVAR